LSALLEAPTVVPDIDTADRGPDELTHIVNCPADKESAEAWVTEARVMGLELEALCGFRWMPTKDPSRFPVCTACLDMAGIIAVEEMGE
jgi:hypothetical protein